MTKTLKVQLMTLLLISPFAHAIEIVASVKPLQFIALEVARGVGEVDLLISSTASPHDYSLKPSDVRKVKQADLVIWFGPDLESFLDKVISNNSNALQISDSGIPLREYKTAHKGHNHGNYDPHVWLGPSQAEALAGLIADRLAELDADNAAVYKDNAAKFSSRLRQVTEQISQQLSPVQEKGYYVFHDAYGYFEDAFNLKKSGYFTLSPERKPGAKTLIQIRTALKKGEARCVFSEPQFKPSIVESVTRGSDVYIGELDPLATNIEAAPGAYYRFIQGIAASYIDCLSY